MSWTVIDCDYIFPRFAASFLLSHQGKSIFVENNTSRAIPNLIRALQASRSTADGVELLVVTHAHLDHAGGTSALLKLCPNATVIAHPKAAKTLKDPSRLIASAKQVYGDEEFSRLYGEIERIPENRIREVKDGETLSWSGHRFEFIYTLGHASHHVCMIDPVSSCVFTGDSFGVSYPDLKGSEPFHFPSSSPIDFDAAEAVKAVDRIIQTNIQTAYLTHFGAVTGLQERADQLKAHIRFHDELMQWAEQSDTEDDRVAELIYSRLVDYFKKCLEQRSIPWNEETKKLLKLDMELNASGLAYRALKRRKEKSCVKN